MVLEVFCTQVPQITTLFEHACILVQTQQMQDWTQQFNGQKLDKNLTDFVHKNCIYNLYINT